MLTLVCTALQSTGELDSLSSSVPGIHTDASKCHFSVICLWEGCFSEEGGSIWVAEVLLIDLIAVLLAGRGRAALFTDTDEQKCFKRIYWSFRQTGVWGRLAWHLHGYHCHQKRL